MNVLVTGGSGFLGLALCRALVLQGHQVSSFQRHFSAELKHLGVRQVLGALNDKDKLLEALRDQQAVLHNAADNPLMAGIGRATLDAVLADSG